MRTSARVVLTIVLAGAAGPARLAAQVVASEATARCWSATATLELVAAGEGCVPVWADSLRSTVPAHSSRARIALTSIGGRAAVDALRADYERAPTRASRQAAITAMGTTGSPEDIAFLAAHLDQPFLSVPDRWPAIHAAATTLGLLRATGAREALRAALARNSESNTFAGRAISTALQSLDRPPCADSAVGNVERELMRIVIACRPQPMWVGQQYHDATAGGIWTFARDAWQFTTGAPVDTTIPRVRIRATIASNGRHAQVDISTWCGLRCGEGWTFGLLRAGAVWRVVSAVMHSVS